MSTVSRPRFRGLFIIAALVALFVAAPAAQAASTGPIFKAPVANKGTYLALGDSLAFGYQGYKVAACVTTGCTSPDTQFSTGYVNVFASLFGTTYPGVTTVNLGCPGETSDTLLNATNDTTGCTTYNAPDALGGQPLPIHVNHPGKTQIQAALNYLGDGKTNPVTIDIGANDVLALVRRCGGFTDLTCIQNGALAPGGTFDTIQANLGAALKKIRAASNSEIIVIGLYNPLYVAVLGDPSTWTSAKFAAGAQTDQLTNLLNSQTAATAANYRAYFVDPMSTFNPSNGSNPPLEFGTLCQLTLMCAPSPGGDIHASDAGYQALGSLVKTASQY